jgi:hypothetical protein
MIPLSTTTITVLRIPQPNEYDEPYDGSGEPERDVVATGVRAVIDYPGGTIDVEGGQQNVADYGLKCDPVQLAYSDWIKDEFSARVYRIVWYLQFPGSHVEARLRDTEGEV